MDLRFLFFLVFFYSLFSTGLKVASSKGGEQGGSGAREGQGALRGRGDSFFCLYRGLRGVEEEVPPGTRRAVPHWRGDTSASGTVVPLA